MPGGEVYRLRYYAELAQKDGGVVRLEMYLKSPRAATVVPLEIGGVIQNLSLEVQGMAGSVDDPIVKTSLMLTVVDAPEYNTDAQKCGGWEEFYTSDATLWKVLLYGKSKGEQEFRPIWGGYVTPDSYVETLCYHGSVSIVARDNIGLLDNKDFNAVGNDAGMITPYELVTQAWAKIDSPMSLDWRGFEDENEWLQCEGVDAVETYINLSAFEDMTWYQVLYDVLSSYGITMRYTGNNRVSVCPLRRMPMQGSNYEHIEYRNPVFEAYATRELTPAAKKIEEQITYDVDGYSVPLVSEGDFDGTSVDCIVTWQGIAQSGQVKIQAYPIKNTQTSVNGWGNIASNTMFFNPAMYTTSYPIKDLMLLIANTRANKQSWYSYAVNKMPDMTLNIELGNVFESFDGFTGLSIKGGATIDNIEVSIKLEEDSGEHWYREAEVVGGYTWSPNYGILKLVPNEDGIIDFNIGRLYNVQNGRLIVFFERINVTPFVGDTASTASAYVALKNMSFVCDTQTVVGDNTIKTIYNDANNVLLTRIPMVAPTFDDVPMAGMIRNGIFRKDGDKYVPTPLWKWKDDEAEPQQMGVFIHQQILCFHSKPNNVISGTIVGSDLTRFSAIWVWRGKEHFLMSGSYNFCTGKIDSAQLREFVRYEDMW